MIFNNVVMCTGSTEMIATSISPVVGLLLAWAIRQPQKSLCTIGSKDYPWYHLVAFHSGAQWALQEYKHVIPLKTTKS
jgi:hypothetical protein